MSNPPNPPYKIFVSAPLNTNLSPAYLAIKKKIIERLEQWGFEPQLLGEQGISIARSTNWNIDLVDQVMRYCQGAVILGFARWECLDNDQWRRFATEFTHVEGAVALMRGLPTFIVKDNGVSERGILHNSQSLVYMPPSADETWVDGDDFTRKLQYWRENVEKRYHVFLGYSSGATSTAVAIRDFLRGRGVRVLDWQTDFQAGGTVLEQIEQGEQSCLGGIFLFTKDDQLKSKNISHAAPRDNVIFEAGYFINAKSDKRVLIIREEGAKMPADVGGQVYLSLKDRSDISTIEAPLAKFIQDRF